MNYLQSVIAPQQNTASEYPIAAGQPVGMALPTPPPQQIGTGQDAYGLPATITGAVQNGFAPSLALPNAMGSAPDANGGAQVAPAPVVAQTGADLANTLTGQSVTPMPPQPGPAVIPSVTAGAVPMQSQASGIAAPQGADVPLGTVAPTNIAASNAAYAKQQAKQAAFAASPEGESERADAMKQGALNQESQGDKDADAATMAQNTATQAAWQSHVDRQAKQDAIDQAKNAQDAANVDRYTQQYAQQVKDASDYKVNTDRSVGVGGLIAIALSGIGDALDHQHGPNKALEIIESGIDKRINDQWAQKKALGDKAAGTKDVLGVYRTNADDDRQAQSLQKASELQRAADDAKSIAMQSANPLVKARAETTAAGLQQKSADLIQGEAQRKTEALRAQQDEADKAAQRGIAYGELNLNTQKFKYDQQKDDADRAAKLLEATMHGKDTAAGQAATDQALGVKMPSGATTVKNPDGTTTVQPTSDFIKNADGSTYHVPEKLAEKVMPKIEGARNTIDAIDKATKLRSDNGGAIFDTASARALIQQVSNAQSALQEEGGTARISDATLNQAMKRLTGGADPNSVMKSILPALKQARQDQEDRLNNTLKTYGNYDGKPVHIFDPSEDGAKPVKTQNEQDLESVLKKPGVEDYYNEETASAPEDAGIFYGAGPAWQRAQERASGGDLLEPQRQILGNLINTAHSGKPNEAKTARTQLQQIVDSDTASREMRTRAQNALFVLKAVNK